MDCGAYKTLHPDQHVKDQYTIADRDGMIAFHKQELSEFASTVVQIIDEQRRVAEDEFNAARDACTAHKEPDPKNTCWSHVKDLAEEKIKAWTDIRVSCFVMDLLGEVKQLGVPKGQRATPNGEL